MTKPILGKQRTYAGAYSADNIGDRDSKSAGDVPCSYTKTTDKVRPVGGDYDSLPSARPGGRQQGPDGFKLGKQLQGIDDGPSSRALNKEWHARGGFSAEVSRADNHPGKGTANMKSRGADSGGNVGSPKGAPYSWE